MTQEAESLSPCGKLGFSSWLLALGFDSKSMVIASICGMSQKIGSLLKKKTNKNSKTTLLTDSSCHLLFALHNLLLCLCCLF